MSNSEIARAFQMLAKLMELHGDNPFKIRSYQNAYNSLRKVDRPLSEMSDDEISAIKGVGKAIVGKIHELVRDGEMQKLNAFKSKTPEGILELLTIKGLGPKKVKAIWDALDITTVGELLYACYENRLVDLKGFGLKTQEDIKRKLEYYQESKDKYLFGPLENDISAMYRSLQDLFPGKKLEFAGEIARKCPIINSIEFLIASPVESQKLAQSKDFSIEVESPGSIQCIFRQQIPLTLYLSGPDRFAISKMERIGSPQFVEALKAQEGWEALHDVTSEKEIFEALDLPYIIPELREDASLLEDPQSVPCDLIEVGDIAGILHNHSTYSDGLHSLEDMAGYVRDSGYAYFAITDHSRTAVYAGGLQPGELIAQVAEIDRLNAEMHPFKVFKGIESDILTDGSLDYPDEILKILDLVVVSVHAQLKMDIDTATARLVKAIENPYTTILGHPTGRLLLTREGYPIDHQYVIDACAANGVAIELNANPLRLDLDYTWIPYAMEKHVQIAINPDAHSKEGIHNIRYGVLAARKGMLTKDYCLNAKSLQGFEQWLEASR